MHRASLSAYAFLGLGAIALGSLINGCAASNAPDPTITQPPFASGPTPQPTPHPTPTPTPIGTPTPTPTPSSTGSPAYYLIFQPQSVTFNPGSTTGVGMTIDGCDPSGSCQEDSETNMTTDNCDSQGIAHIDVSGAHIYGGYEVTPLANNGSCFYVVQDQDPNSPWYLQSATGNVTNNSNAAKRRRH